MFALDFRATDKAIATACFVGISGWARNSLFMFEEITLLDVPFFNGIPSLL